MRYLVRLVLLSTVIVSLNACAPDGPFETPVAGRWYTVEQVARGEELFQQYCATCHGNQGQGTADWRKTDANGDYPPPPLNGTAHTWHHPTEILLRTIEKGGVPLGGVMPAFGSVLDENQALDVITHVQSLWTDDVYDRWLEIESR